MDDRDQIVLPRNYSVFHDIDSIPPIYEALTVTFVKQPSFHSLDTCEYQWFDKRKAMHTSIFKVWSFLVWNNYCTICAVCDDFPIELCWSFLTFPAPKAVNDVGTSAGQWRDWRGERGKPSPWQAKCKNWATLWLRFWYLYSLICCFLHFSGCFRFFLSGMDIHHIQRFTLSFFNVFLSFG